MEAVDKAFGVVKTLLLDVIALILGVFVAVEAWARVTLAQAGVPRDLTNVVLIALAIALFLFALRVFGGIIRVLLVLFLMLLVVHLLLGTAHAEGIRVAASAWRELQLSQGGS